MLSKIKSLDELKKIKEDAMSRTDIRTNVDNPNRIVIAVGLATCGIAAGARETVNVLLERIEEKRLKDVSVITTGCLGFCYAEPLVEVRPANGPIVQYQKVDGDMAKRIIDEHIGQGILVEDAIFNRGGN